MVQRISVKQHSDKGKSHAAKLRKTAREDRTLTMADTRKLAGISQPRLKELLRDIPNLRKDLERQFAQNAQQAVRTLLTAAAGGDTQAAQYLKTVEETGRWSKPAQAAAVAAEQDSEPMFEDPPDWDVS